MRLHLASDGGRRWLKPFVKDVFLKAFFTAFVRTVS
jgi:hypothetical protein